MRSQIYHLLKSFLLSIKDDEEKSIIQHVDVWNNQLAFVEEEQPFSTPAVFVEFAPIHWKSQMRGVLDAEVDIKLHIVTDSRVGKWDDALEAFDLIDNKIPPVLARVQKIAPTYSIGAFTRISSASDHDHDELQDNTEVYRVHVQQSY